ncbi:MAG: aminotransferase class V-fold PLP-dependent enzyme, partial [Rhodothermales bacterium]|nr:aminotransferase class V-fold PLP-dependent enzyme [Rhodothermales bacterium]
MYQESDVLVDIRSLRAEIPLLDRCIALANCSHAPQTRAASEAAAAFLESWNQDGMDWDTWIAEVDAARAAFARLIGAEPDEIAVTSSVSAATAAVASSLDFTGERSRVVVSDAEFPGTAHAWAAHGRSGAEYVRVPARGDTMHAGDYRELVDERTAVVSASHAWFRNGSLQDVAEIVRTAREAGALTYIDAYQTAGVFPIDVKALDVDFLSSGVLKYLMGIPGIAFLYVRSDLAESLQPAFTGWFGRNDPFEFDPGDLDPAPGARRFDIGTPPIINAYVARAGIEWILNIGVEAVRDRTLQLSRRIAEQLGERGLTIDGPADPVDRTPVTAVACEHAASVEATLRERGILVSARGSVVRLAPHVFNTFEEVDAAVDALADVV